LQEVDNEEEEEEEEAREVPPTQALHVSILKVH
jgi:hypothetical protein